MKKIKFTQEQFLENCKKIHGDKYDYSKSVYVDSNTKIIIICKKHGEFLQAPLKHYNKKQGCPLCSNNIKKTTEQIIEEFKKVHGEKYNYSKVNYKTINSKIIIICKKHGEFEQTPKIHLKGFGCSICSGNKKLTNEEFIEKAKQIHGNKYDYSKTNYTGAFNKVTIICPIHGEFNQIARNHIMINKTNGCPKCKTSKGEKIIINFLDSKKIKYIHQKTFKNCKDINVLPFDFYLPQFNLCIEFDGQQHFRKEGYFGGINGYNDRVKKDKIKNEYCRANKIHLLRIKYTENIIEKINEYLF